MLVHALSRREHVCVVAENGREAVDLVKENVGRFDMIFMDNTMPVMVSLACNMYFSFLVLFSIF